MIAAARGGRVALLAVVLIAAGCAHVEREPRRDGLSFDERRQQLMALPAWQMRGRLAVNTGERAFQGSFSWLQDDMRSTLIVRGPLGGGILEVTGSPQQMTVRARGEQRVLEDPEAELSALLGWWMPVDSLSAWLLGLPDPEHSAATRFGPNAALEALDQRLWHVEYDAYQLVDGVVPGPTGGSSGAQADAPGGGVLVPRRIAMAHDTLELRLTVDAWEPASGAP